MIGRGGEGCGIKTKYMLILGFSLGCSFTASVLWFTTVTANHLCQLALT